MTKRHADLEIGHQVYLSQIWTWPGTYSVFEGSTGVFHMLLHIVSIGSQLLAVVAFVESQWARKPRFIFQSLQLTDWQTLRHSGRETLKLQYFSTHFLPAGNHMNCRFKVGNLFKSLTFLSTWSGLPCNMMQIWVQIQESVIECEFKGTGAIGQPITNFSQNLWTDKNCWYQKICGHIKFFDGNSML